MNGRTILGVLLTLLFTLQFTAFAIVHILQEREHDRYRADNDERRLRFENEMRALTTAQMGSMQWPTTETATPVKAKDLVESWDGYVNHEVAVLVFGGLNPDESGNLLWRIKDDDHEAIVFQFENRHEQVTGKVWVIGRVVGIEEDGRKRQIGGSYRVVVADCRIVTGR